MEPEILANLAGNLGAVGFVSWLAHRLTTRTIPDMAKSFGDAYVCQRKDFRDALDQQRNDFQEFHKRELEAHVTRLQAVMDRCLAGDRKNK